MFVQERRTYETGRGPVRDGRGAGDGGQAGPSAGEASGEVQGGSIGPSNGHQFVPGAAGHQSKCPRTWGDETAS
jgi:hypothetical protein